MIDADRAGLAAEYVLGTLDAEERAAAAALIETDPSFAARVAEWEQGLGELHAMVDPVPPPPELWIALRARLAEAAPGPDLRLPGFLAHELPAPAAHPDGDGDAPRPETVADHDGPPDGGRALAIRSDPGDDDGETVRRLVRSVQTWRSMAVGLAAFAAALAGLTVMAALSPDSLPAQLRPKPQVVEVPREVVRTIEVPREVVRTVEVPGRSPGRFVAVLQGGSASPAFLLTVDPDRKSLMVRRVAAEDEGDKRYALWLVSDRLPAPRPLGLLGTAEFTTVPAIAAFEPEIVDGAVYAVSLEAATDPPTDGPSGPVLYSGRLLEAVPPEPAGGR